MRKSANKRPVKIAKTQKGPNILYFVGYGPILYSCDFCGVHACYPLFKDYPQVIYRWGMERALLRLEVQVVLLCYRKNVLNSGNMIREGCGRSDSDIIHVDSDDCSLQCMFGDDFLVYIYSVGSISNYALQGTPARVLSNFGAGPISRSPSQVSVPQDEYLAICAALDAVQVPTNTAISFDRGSWTPVSAAFPLLSL